MSRESEFLECQVRLNVYTGSTSSALVEPTIVLSIGKIPSRLIISQSLLFISAFYGVSDATIRSLRPIGTASCDNRLEIPLTRNVACSNLPILREHISSMSQVIHETTISEPCNSVSGLYGRQDTFFPSNTSLASSTSSAGWRDKCAVKFHPKLNPIHESD